MTENIFALDMNKASSWPGYSDNERIRRWKLVRDLMKGKELDCLVVFDLEGPEEFGQYLTNDQGGGIVIFPLEGQLIHLVRNYFNVAGVMEGHLMGEAVWTHDARAPAMSSSIIEVLEEKGYGKSNIGVVGLGGQLPGGLEGYIPYKMWSNIVESLPHVQFHDITNDFCKLVVVKSEEELTMLRRAAQVAEIASKTMLDMSKPGVSEREIYAAVVYQIHIYGTNTSPSKYTTPLILHSGQGGTPTWGPPRWLLRGQLPRIIERSDVITSEIFCTYGGQLAQTQMCIGIEPLDSETIECARLAKQAYQAGVKALEPGKTLAQVADKMDEALQQAGAYHLSPHIHTLSPANWVGPMATGVWDNLPGIEAFKKMRRKPGHAGAEQFVIEPNTAFALEPNASIGRHRVNIGGTVIVTENGVEELNQISIEMRTIS